MHWNGSSAQCLEADKNEENQLKMWLKYNENFEIDGPKVDNWYVKMQRVKSRKATDVFWKIEGPYSLLKIRTNVVFEDRRTIFFYLRNIMMFELEGRRAECAE